MEPIDPRAWRATRYKRTGGGGGSDLTTCDKYPRRSLFVDLRTPSPFDIQEMYAGSVAKSGEEVPPYVISSKSLSKLQSHIDLAEVPLSAHRRRADWLRGGRPAPSCSTGVVVGRASGRRFGFPVTCRRYDCGKCAARRRSMVQAALLRGWRRKFLGREMALFTTTFRTKKQRETWPAFLKRTGVDGKWQREKLEVWRETHDKPSRSEMLAYMQEVLAECMCLRLEGACHCLAYVRSLWTPVEWTVYVQAIWQYFTRDYERKFGQRLSYVQAVEFTRQGNLHLHSAIPVPRGIDGVEWAGWLVSHMCVLVPDSLEQAQDVSLRGDYHGRGSNGKLGYENRGAYSAVWYVLKYIYKGYGDGGKLPKAWQGFRFRTWRRSQDWQMPMQGCREKFTTETEVGRLPFDEMGYKRQYGRVKYYEGRLKDWTVTPDKMQHYKTRLAREKLLLSELDELRNLREYDATFISWDRSPRGGWWQDNISQVWYQYPDGAISIDKSLDVHVLDKARGQYDGLQHSIQASSSEECIRYECRVRRMLASCSQHTLTSRWCEHGES